MSDLGNLSQCMMDSDAAANGRARRLRGKALLVSLSLEAAVIAGVLLWPLVTLGGLTPQLMLTPVPPYRGDRISRPAPPHQNRLPATTQRTIDWPLLQPPSIPSHVTDGPDPQPPGDPYGTLAGQSGPSVGIPGGSDTGPLVEIARPGLASKPRKVSLGVMDASLIHRVQPDYPRIATLTRLSGSVTLRAVIGTDGEVHELEVLNGNPILAAAALAAVRQWRYRPTLLDGQAVEVETQITVNFVPQ
jgi:periplasmic protein TonB